MTVVNSLASGLAYIASGLLLYVALLLGYRVTLHPLSAYPGPLAAKLSGCYSLYHAATKRLHLAIWQDHIDYGPVVRLGPNKLVFNSVTALRDIYNNDQIIKSRAYLVTLQSPQTHSIFNAIDKQEHRGKRKIIGQALAPRFLRDFEPIMIRQIYIFLNQILISSQDPAAVAINMTPRCKYLGIDIVSLLAFGKPLHTQTSHTNRFFADGFAAGNFFQNMRLQYPRLQQLRFNEALSMLKGIQEKRARYRELIEKLIRERLAEDDQAQRDLYSVVAGSMDVKGNGNLRDSEFWSESIFFLPAGGDTTTTCMAAVFFYLSRNPDCYKRLSEEISSSFRSGAEIRDNQQLKDCCYLRACIDETLRISPPVPGALWREQSPTDPTPLIVDGHVIPRGTEIGVSTYSLHHNPEYYPDPFSFKPERWLEDMPEAKRTIMREAFNPFSLGARGCAGKAMAYMEASLAIAKTLWYFDFETAPGAHGPDELGGGTEGDTKGRGRTSEFQLHDIFSTTHDGPNLVFHPREGMVHELLTDAAEAETN